VSDRGEALGRIRSGLPVSRSGRHHQLVLAAGRLPARVQRRQTRCRSKLAMLGRSQVMHGRARDEGVKQFRSSPTQRLVDLFPDPEAPDRALRRTPWHSRQQPCRSSTRGPVETIFKETEALCRIAPASCLARSGERARWRGWAGSKHSGELRVIARAPEARRGRRRSPGTRSSPRFYAAGPAHGAILRTQYPTRGCSASHERRRALPGVIAVITRR